MKYQNAGLVQWSAPMENWGPGCQMPCLTTRWLSPPSRLWSSLWEGKPTDDEVAHLEILLEVEGCVLQKGEYRPRVECCASMLASLQRNVALAKQGTESQLCHFLAVWPWKYSLTSLCPSIFICTVEQSVSSFVQWNNHNLQCCCCYPCMWNDLVFMKLLEHHLVQKSSGISLVVQWLGLCPSTAGDTGLIPGRRTKIP